MKTIRIALNQESIARAKRELLNYRMNLITALDVFYERCVSYLIKQANYYVKKSDIGALVKANITSSWTVQKLEQGGIRLTNNAEKAIFVECGVGIVGEQNPHPNATSLGNNYEYNVPSDGKKDDDSWVFFENRDNLDLPESALIKGNLETDSRYFNERDRLRTRLRVRTKGTEGVMYAFNALQDLKMEYRKIWNEVAKEFLE